MCSEQLRDLSFINWTLEEEDRLNQSITASQEGREEEEFASNQENAFDAFAVPEPLDDFQGAEGMVDHDMEDFDELAEVSERAQGHGAAREAPGFTANLQVQSLRMESMTHNDKLKIHSFPKKMLSSYFAQMSTADMLSILTTAPLEYSYFDHGKLGAWAGPKHWKFKALAR